jgi:opacity protein-like surface antigen
MKSLLVGAALMAAVAAPLSAQDAGTPVTDGHGSAFAGPYVGYMKFGELFDFGADRDLTFDDGLFYGAQLGYSFNPNFSVLGNLGYTKSNLEVKQNMPDPDVDQSTSGDLGVFLYDANVQFRLPVALGTGSASFAPFVQGGIGQLKYTADYDDLGSKGKTSTTFNVGLGADVQLTKYAGLRLMAKDYITSLSWDQFENVSFDDNVKNNTAHNLAFTVGVNLGF